MTRSMVDDGWDVPRPSYVIEASRYRAVLPACMRDDCATGAVKPCVRKLDDRHLHSVSGSKSVDAWLRHSAKHCHGWHDERVRHFAEQVAQTFPARIRVGR